MTHLYYYKFVKLCLIIHICLNKKLKSKHHLVVGSSELFRGAVLVDIEGVVQYVVYTNPLWENTSSHNCSDDVLRTVAKAAASQQARVTSVLVVSIYRVLCAPCLPYGRTDGLTEDNEASSKGKTRARLTKTGK